MQQEINAICDTPFIDTNMSVTVINIGERGIRNTKIKASKDCRDNLPICLIRNSSIDINSSGQNPNTRRSMIDDACFFAQKKNIRKTQLKHKEK